MSRLLRALLALLLLVTGLAALQVSSSGPAVSPFRGMRAVESGIEVQVQDETWVALVTLAGVDTATLLRESRRLCGAQAWKRLTEDLPALLDAMGHKVGLTVDLEVRDLATGAVRKLAAVELTRENRDRLKAANRERSEPEPKPVPAILSAEDARADLDELRRLLDERFAYRELRPVDLDLLLREAASSLGDGAVERASLLGAVDRILRAFGDGHSRVVEAPPSTAAFLPFLVQEASGGHVAFRHDRAGFIDPARPFVAALDGVPLERWLAAARARGTQGSATMQAREAERGLRDLGDLRLALELPAEKTVKVTLRGKGGTKDVSLAVSDRRPVYGAWPRTETRRLDGRFGYLRIAEMESDDEFLDALDVAMATFRDTQGLVVDVRGNGGGSRDALRRLAPYFLPEQGKPVVGNVAALLTRGRPPAPDALADRGLYPAEWPGWSAGQRESIATFTAGFRPSWTLPAGKFSDWRYLVLAREDNPKAWPYAGRVVVLIDRACFSATDVFAAALGALPQVTLVGETTSGGSGRAASQRLSRSGIELQLSTMASFRPDGVLFEGNGVAPDFAVTPEPGDLVGASDTALKRALELLHH